MIRSKATFMKLPGSWGIQLIFSFILGLSLAGKIVFGYTVSESLSTFPLELVSPLGLLLAVGSGLCLTGYYLGSFDDFDRLALDSFGSIIFTGTWAVVSGMTYTKLPDSLFFASLALCMATCGVAHLHYLYVVRKAAYESRLEETLDA